MVDLGRSKTVKMANCANIFSPDDFGGTMSCAALTSTLEEVKVMCSELNALDGFNSFFITDGTTNKEVIDQNSILFNQAPGLNLEVSASNGGVVTAKFETPAPTGTLIEDWFYMFDDVTDTFFWTSWSQLISQQTGFFKQFFFTDSEANNTSVEDGDEFSILPGPSGGITPVVGNLFVTMNWTTEPTTGGTTSQVYVFDDNTDTWSWIDVTTLSGSGIRYYQRFDVAASTSILTITENGGVLPINVGRDIKVYQWPAGKKLLETDEFTVAGSNIQLAPGVVLPTVATYEVFFTI